MASRITYLYKKLTKNFLQCSWIVTDPFVYITCLCKCLLVCAIGQNVAKPQAQPGCAKGHSVTLVELLTSSRTSSAAISHENEMLFVYVKWSAESARKVECICEKSMTYLYIYLYFIWSISLIGLNIHIPIQTYALSYSSVRVTIIFDNKNTIITWIYFQNILNIWCSHARGKWNLIK